MKLNFRKTSIILILAFISAIIPTFARASETVIEKTIYPSHDAYVCFGASRNTNHEYNDTVRQRLEFFQHKPDGAVFLKFPMGDLADDFSNSKKAIKSAHLEFEIEQKSSKAASDIIVQDMRDNWDWNESTMTGKIACKYKDRRKIATYPAVFNGKYSINITEGVKSYLNNPVNNNNMTLRLHSVKNNVNNLEDWFYMHSRHTSKSPKLVIKYVERPIKTMTISAEDTHYVAWGKDIKKHFSSPSSAPAIKNSNLGSTYSRTAFTKFDLSTLEDKRVMSAKFEYNLRAYGGVQTAPTLTFCEDIDAIDWCQDTLTGNIAKRWDNHKYLFKNRVHSKSHLAGGPIRLNDYDGAFQFGITDLVREFFQRDDADNKMTIRMNSSKKGKSYYLRNNSTNHPKIIVEYVDLSF
ncbi:DNRLRE domain-containing protein [Clostridiaceae bacterium M8S5]|nr:DNRLRE domain-containing protein [Clostridiaceae bacterium M8S5]